MKWESADEFLNRVAQPPAIKDDIDKGIPFSERPLRPGGLYRCCTQTWNRTKDLSVIGTVVPCPHCMHAMIVAVDGTVEWHEKWRPRR